jgi:hypothetical protein
MANPPARIPVVFTDPDTGERKKIGTAIVDEETGMAKVEIEDPRIKKSLGSNMGPFSILEG